MMLTEYDKLLESLKYVKSIVNIAPKIGIVCGSGLGELVNIIENPISIPYTKIPHFPKSTVVGHSGELVFGKKDGLPLVCMRGRVHLYEGYEVYECIRPIRLMAMLGIEILCVTNAAGNVNKNYKPGDFMVIKDHISFPSLAGENPLRGPHDPRFGDRFVTMSNAYDSELINELEDAAASLKLDRCLKKGIYAMVVGPTYETIAEARALRLLGADAIGMSTVHEIIAAHQMGVRCLGISLLTNDILTDYDSMEDIVEHEHVVDMGARRSQDFIALILAFIKSVRKEIKLELSSTPPKTATTTTTPVTTQKIKREASVK
jgi:purine-nucleoside phosphorylase